MTNLPHNRSPACDIEYHCFMKTNTIYTIYIYSKGCTWWWFQAIVGHSSKWKSSSSIGAKEHVRQTTTCYIITYTIHTYTALNKTYSDRYIHTYTINCNYIYISCYIHRKKGAPCGFSTFLVIKPPRYRSWSCMSTWKWFISRRRCPMFCTSGSWWFRCNQNSEEKPHKLFANKKSAIF